MESHRPDKYFFSYNNKGELSLQLACDDSSEVLRSTSGKSFLPVCIAKGKILYSALRRTRVIYYILFDIVYFKHSELMLIMSGVKISGCHLCLSSFFLFLKS